MPLLLLPSQLPLLPMLPMLPLLPPLPLQLLRDFPEHLVAVNGPPVSIAPRDRHSVVTPHTDADRLHIFGHRCGLLAGEGLARCRVTRSQLCFGCVLMGWGMGCQRSSGLGRGLQSPESEKGEGLRYSKKRRSGQNGLLT